LKGLTLPFYHRQYAIRRIEFDDWLLKRSGVPVIQHKAQHIVFTDNQVIIDGQYGCRYLIGAGGTHCPVYKTFFRSHQPKSSHTLITTIEEEFPYDVHHHDCHLWFFENNLPGYAWYVPKKGGYVNVGIGGAFQPLKQGQTTIREHWNHLIEKLHRLRFVTTRSWHPRGYHYYLRQPVDRRQSGNVYLIGDAAGMATLDMGEGIGPAIQSGQAVAQAIIHSQPYSPATIRKFSGPTWLSRSLLKIGSRMIS
jgi:flavin-dependent dehydrogenase